MKETRNSNGFRMRQRVCKISSSLPKDDRIPKHDIVVARSAANTGRRVLQRTREGEEDLKQNGWEVIRDEGKTYE